MKNFDCKTENGYELIGYGGTPVNITKKIEDENCECLNEIVIVNPHPKLFSKTQLRELKNNLPVWAKNNLSNFTEQDVKNLIEELQVSDDELQKKFKYKFSYFGKPAEAEIPIYTFSIKNHTVYCPNYFDEYSNYGLKDKFGFEAFPQEDKPDYPIIENENWALNEFGLK